MHPELNATRGEARTTNNLHIRFFSTPAARLVSFLSDCTSPYKLGREKECVCVHNACGSVKGNANISKRKVFSPFEILYNTWDFTILQIFKIVRTYSHSIACSMRPFVYPVDGVSVLCVIVPIPIVNVQHCIQSFCFVCVCVCVYPFVCCRRKRWRKAHMQKEK